MEKVAPEEKPPVQTEAASESEGSTYPYQVRVPKGQPLEALRAFADNDNRPVANAILHLAMTNPEFVEFCEQLDRAA